MSGGTTAIQAYLQTGSNDAFNRIYDLYKPRALALAALRLPERVQRLVPPEACADTALRQAVEALRKRPIGEVKSKDLERLLFAILQSNCFETYRRACAEKRDIRRSVPFEDIYADTRPLDEAIVAEEVASLIDLLISKETGQTREILSMKMQLGMSAKEIAPLVKRSVRVVQVVIKEARERAWRILNDELRPGAELERLPDEI